MEEALIALLLSHAPLTALLGQKIRPGRANQADLPPFAVVQVIDSNRSYTYAGDVGLIAARVQIDVYAETYSAAKQAARLIEARLSGHRDQFFQAIFLTDQRDLPAADAGAVTTKFRTSIDITVHYGEQQ